MDDTIGRNISSNIENRQKQSQEGNMHLVRRHVLTPGQWPGNIVSLKGTEPHLSLIKGHHSSEVVRWSISVHRIPFQYLQSKSSSKSFNTFATQWDQVDISTSKRVDYTPKRPQKASSRFECTYVTSVDPWEDRWALKCWASETQPELSNHLIELLIFQGGKHDPGSTFWCVLLSFNSKWDDVSPKDKEKEIERNSIISYVLLSR